MREENISKMNFKELRDEVQALRDELAIFKRKYEDAIYNLDSDNLGKGFTATQDNMKAQLKLTADAIKSAVTQEKLDEKLKNYSTAEQTAEKIKLTVNAEYVTNLIGDEYVTNETLKDYATIELTKNGLSSYVQRQADLKNAITITDLLYATDTSKTYKVQKFNSSGDVIEENYYYYNSLSNNWEKISGDTVYTMFEQTGEGFVLKGNTVIDGTTTITRNLVLSGNVTWDMDNSPVLTRYSSDGYYWHSPMAYGDKYMQMSFDGGNNWSTTTKVVGDNGRDGQDGRDGNDGSDANVTPENVFYALTGEGSEQGLFSAFYEKENKLFINAEYISTDIAQVSSSLNIGDPNSTEEKMLSFNNTVKLRGEDAFFYVSCQRAYFEDLSELDDEPLFYINNKQVATQDWVKSRGASIAVFG